MTSSLLPEPLSLILSAAALGQALLCASLLISGRASGGEHRRWLAAVFTAVALLTTGPVTAVIAAGKEIVKSGSITARSGNINGLRMLTLTRCCGEPNTALRVTSDPVPAVVGMAMYGADG